jgi:hypothetical protein
MPEHMDKRMTWTSGGNRQEDELLRRHLSQEAGGGDHVFYQTRASYA